MKNIFIIAGESSGDQHAQSMLEHKKINPNINFTGIGQNALENEGVNLILTLIK